MYIIQTNRKIDRHADNKQTDEHHATKTLNKIIENLRLETKYTYKKLINPINFPQLRLNNL